MKPPSSRAPPGKRRVGAALSLDAFATAKVSGWDKRKVLDKQRALKAKEVNKYRKLQKRLADMLGPSLPLEQLAHEYEHSLAEAGARPPKKQKRRQPGLEVDGGPRQQRERPALKPAAQQHEQLQPQQHEQHQHQNQQQQHSGEQPQPQPGGQARAAKKHRHAPKPPSQLQRLAGKAAADKAAAERARLDAQRAHEEHAQQLEARKKARSHQKHDFFRRTKRGQPVMKYRVDKILAQLQAEKAR